VNLLARVLIAKIENEDRLGDILRNIPVVQGNPNWRCRTWLANALAAIKADDKAVGTSQLNWVKIEKAAREYVAGKVASGRYMQDALKPKPTWDMIEEKETVP
jgi:hypothetical protein